MVCSGVFRRVQGCVVVCSLVLQVPAAELGLQDVQQQLLDVARGQLVDVPGRQLPRTDLQLVLHGLEDPAWGGGIQNESLKKIQNACIVSTMNTSLLLPPPFPLFRYLPH